MTTIGFRPKTGPARPSFVKNAKPPKAKPQNGRAPNAGERLYASDRLLGTIPNIPPAVLVELGMMGLRRIQDLEDLADRQWDGNVYHALRSFPKITEAQARAAHSAIGPRGPVPAKNGKPPEVPAPAPPSPASGQLDSMPLDDSEGGVRLIPLGRIAASPLNPRKHFDQDELESLARSIKSVGVQSPILVRPHPAAGAVPAYEIVAGERRWRAARMAGLNVIPAIVRALGDDVVLEMMLIENVRRADLSPLEKADGYAALMEKFGKSVKDLVEGTGESETTVRKLLKLRDLPAAAAAALKAGTLPATTADLIARVPGAKTRERVALHVLAGEEWWSAEVTKVPKDAEPLSYRDARQMIATHCTVELKGAPFDRGAINLIAAAGSCDDCPKRVGNLQKENPGEYRGIRADVCTDPECYAAKVAGWQKCVADAAAAAGQSVLSAKECETVFYHDGLSDSGSDQYVDLAAQCWEAPHKGNQAPSYKKLLDGKVDTVVGFDRRGNKHVLVPKAEAAKVLKEKGITIGQRNVRDGNGRLTPTAAELKQRREEKIAAEVNRRIMAEIVSTAEGCIGEYSGDGEWSEILRVMARGAAIEVWNEILGKVMSRRERAAAHYGERQKKLLELVNDLSDGQLFGLLAELVLTRSVTSHWGDNLKKAEVLKAFGVDAKRVEREVRAGMAEKAKPKAKVKS